MIVAGIDPGKRGALAVAGGVTLSAYPVPTMRVKGKEVPDYIRWRSEWTLVMRQAEHVFIERVAARPGQGVSSMFNFGYVAGFVYGLVLANHMPHSFITPQSWKKVVGLSGSDGEESRRRASELWPSGIDLWARKKDDGIAEAALIAWAGRRILQNIEGKSSES